MKCPICDSPQPHLHPAMQFEGEVEICPDAFHLTKSPQNTDANIALVKLKRDYAARERVSLSHEAAS